MFLLLLVATFSIEFGSYSIESCISRVKAWTFQLSVLYIWLQYFSVCFTALFVKVDLEDISTTNPHKIPATSQLAPQNSKAALFRSPFIPHETNSAAIINVNKTSISFITRGRTNRTFPVETDVRQKLAQHSVDNLCLLFIEKGIVDGRGTLYKGIPKTDFLSGTFTRNGH